MFALVARAVCVRNINYALRAYIELNSYISRQTTITLNVSLILVYLLPENNKVSRKKKNLATIGRMLAFVATFTVLSCRLTIYHQHELTLTSHQIILHYEFGRQIKAG
jgi:hypothetical protein